MRTRRSPRNQQRLYRDIGRQLARAASASAEPEEANPDIYACPDGARCQDPECITENLRRAGGAQ